MPVLLFWSARLRSLWVQLAIKLLMSGEGYFEKLATAVTNNKTVLERLVASNAKLAATNEELTAVVKILINYNRDIQRESNRLKKRSDRRATQEKRDQKMCPH